MRSAFYWFSKFCHSQSLSHFAASFIDIRAEASIAKSCEKITTSRSSKTEVDRLTVASYLSYAPLAQPGRAHEDFKSPFQRSIHPHRLDSEVELDIFVLNDPSAGSPTETLLRLLLPLSDKVH